MSQIDIDSFYPKSRQAWRAWLQDNHEKKESIWLICYKKTSGMPSISWSEAVEEALCFGWIDSKRKPIDDQKFIQFFCKRKASSTWSKVNKDKVLQLIEKGNMTAAGLKVIEVAKQNGSWTILDDVEALVIPDDLNEAFKNHPGSEVFFQGLSKSMKKLLLSWLVLAKRPETRQSRIKAVAQHAGKQMIPRQLQPVRRKK